MKLSTLKVKLATQYDLRQSEIEKLLGKIFNDSKGLKKAVSCHAGGKRTKCLVKYNPAEGENGWELIIEESKMSSVKLKINEDTKLIKEDTDSNLDAIIKVIKDCGWEITAEDDNLITINGYSPAGDDLSFTLETTDILHSLYELADNFDEDDYVKNWLDSGAAGVPDAETLVDDAKDIHNMLWDLCNTVRDLKLDLKRGTDSTTSYDTIKNQTLDDIQRYLDVEIPDMCKNLVEYFSNAKKTITGSTALSVKMRLSKCYDALESLRNWI